MPPKKSSKKKISKKNKKSKKEESTVESSTIESDIQSSSEILEEPNESSIENIDSDTESKDCEVEKMIQDDMEYFNQDDSSELPPEDNTIYLEKDDRITNPRLTRYEMVRIIGERTKQLTMGAKPLVKNYQELEYEEVAIEELKHNMIPFKIKRPLPNNKIEIWELKELDKKHLGSFLYS